MTYTTHYVQQNRKKRKTFAVKHSLVICSGCFYPHLPNNETKVFKFSSVLTTFQLRRLIARGHISKIPWEFKWKRNRVIEGTYLYRSRIVL